MSKPREFWIAVPEWTKDPLGPCENIMRLCASYKFEGAKLFREVLPDQPEDLAPGILKAVEMLEEYANSGVYNSLRIPAECMADWLSAEAIEKGWMKE